MNKPPASSAPGEFDRPMTHLRPWVVLFAVAGFVALLGILAITSTTPPPPVISLLSVEPSGIFDDAGTEMSLVTVSIRNPNAGKSPGKSIYIEYGGRPAEGKVTDRWIRLESTLERLGPCLLQPSYGHITLILAPAATESLRICLRYTRSRVTGGRLARLAAQLPSWIRFRLPAKFWRFAGYAKYGPGSDWREVTFELPQRVPAAMLISEESYKTQ